MIVNNKLPFNINTMCDNHRNMQGTDEEVPVIQTPTKELIISTPWFNELIKDDATNEQIDQFATSLAGIIESKWE